MFTVIHNHQPVFEDEDLDVCVSYAHSIYHYGNFIKIINLSGNIVHLIGIESNMNEPITIEEYIKIINEWKSPSIKASNKP